MKIKKKTLRLVLAIIVIAIAIFVIVSIISKPTYPYISTPKPLLGNKDAAVRIVEFSDLECPACKRAHPVVKTILAEYSDKVSFQFYHFPLTTIHLYAFKAAEAAECANDQGKFFELIDAVYAREEKPTKSVLTDVAEQLGLDTKSFNSCIDSGAKKNFVIADLQEASIRNLYATPTIFINDKKLESWEYDEFKSAVEEALVE